MICLNKHLKKYVPSLFSKSPNFVQRDSRSASSDSNAEVDAIRVLPASLPISILALVLGCQAHRGFLSWAVFALFNGILICRGRR